MKNLRAEPGTKVRVAHPEAGLKHDQEAIAGLDGTYTVKSVAVYAWESHLFLEEFPGKLFNTVNFEEVEP